MYESTTFGTPRNRRSSAILPPIVTAEGGKMPYGAFRWRHEMPPLQMLLKLLKRSTPLAPPCKGREICTRYMAAELIGIIGC